jgi:release factor H-coupled RctB family protein
MYIIPNAAQQPQIKVFASSTSWIEDAAVKQLEQLAARNGVQSVAAMPDLHPGHHGPVGCAMLSKDIVHPDVIGTDIGCGMQMWRVDAKERDLNLDKLETRFAALEGPWDGDAQELLQTHQLISQQCLQFASSIGTIGGGNHFCEVQVVEELVDTDLANLHGLSKGQVTMLVHSGSRGLGTMVLQRHYYDGTAGLALEGAGLAYLDDHDEALKFAALNRRTIAARGLNALRTEGQELIDSPHNFVTVSPEGLLHRKGAAAATGSLVPIAGSRGTYTYLVAPLTTDESALETLAHGAGRKHDRGSMERRIRTEAGRVQKLARTKFGGRVICTDRQLLIEEAPEAYKKIENVIEDLTVNGLARVVAVLRPVLTFKTARDWREAKRKDR